MPLAPTRNLYIWKPSGEATAEETTRGPAKPEESVARDDNVLLERRYLNTYWHYFRASIGVQVVMGTCFTYGGISIATGTFSGSALRSFAGCGLVLQVYAMYLNMIKMQGMQEKIEPLYNR